MTNTLGSKIKITNSVEDSLIVAMSDCYEYA